MALIEKEKPSAFDNGPIGPDGQYRDYAILPQGERDKGFIRPVRRSYKHVGAPAPKYPLRDLTPDELKSRPGYVKYEEYPESEYPVVGRHWTQNDLDAVGRGCGTVTTMGQKLAETYARDLSYYGRTFCCGCGTHIRVNEFVWEGTEERVGS